VKTINFDSFDAFEKCLSPLFAEWKRLKEKKHALYVSTPLFRGHSDASWKLQTTLERCINREFTEFDYYRTIRDVRPAVVSITEKEWSLPEFEGGTKPPTGYEFMIYLRHHGFPSPLLDWTRSPYVAAFLPFAHHKYQRTAESLSILMWNTLGTPGVIPQARPSSMG